MKCFLMIVLLMNAGLVSAQTSNFDNKKGEASDQALLQKLGLDPRGIPEPSVYSAVAQNSCFRVTIYRSPWAKNWGQPVMARLEQAGKCKGQTQIGEKEDYDYGILTTGDLLLGSKPFILELRGLRRGDSFFPFISKGVVKNKVTKDGIEETYEEGDADIGTGTLLKVLELKNKINSR